MRKSETVSALISVITCRGNRCESLARTLYFTPLHQAALSAKDGDVSSGGLLLVPNHSGEFPYEAIGCGTFPVIHVLDPDNRSTFQSGSNNQIIQEVDNQVWEASRHHPDRCSMTPAFKHKTLYFAGINHVLKAFSLNLSSKTPSHPTSTNRLQPGFPGVRPVVSAVRTNNGIVWAVDFSSSASLNAYDATNLTPELYRSPGLGTGAKFVVPSVVNGKVYVGTASKLFVVRSTLNAVRSRADQTANLTEILPRHIKENPRAKRDEKPVVV